eukprot:COSAG04_NODE_12377_length_655_cov_1.892086_1_plen_83_part_01
MLRRRGQNAFVVDGQHRVLGTPSPNERDVSIMRAYVNGMLGQLPGGSKDEIKVGRRTAVAIQTPHLQSQLEVFFARFNGGSGA